MFSAGGEKPPAAPEGGQEDEDEMVPGFPGWQGEEDAYAMDNAQDVFQSQKLGDGEDVGIPGIPGLGAGSSGPAPLGRQSGPLPSQADMLRQVGGVPTTNRWGRKRFAS